MKSKKVVALIVSLALIVGVVLPGTLAFSNEPAGQTQEAAAAADTKLTEEKTQEVKTEEVKTELPKAETPKAEAPKAETPKAQEPQCTCEPKPAEGERHQDNCPVKLAADRAAAEKAAAEAKAKLEAEKAEPKPEEKTPEAKPETQPNPEQKPTGEKTCTCDPQPGEGQAHKEGCPQYVAPQQPAEEKSCTCEPKPGEGQAHKEGCPLYVAPEKTCTCEPKPGEGEAHKVGCPLYVAPEFDAAKAKAEILAMTSIEDVEQYLGGLTEEQRTAILDLFTVEEMEEFARSLGVVTEIEVVTPPVNYTAVGPLMPAVATSTLARPRRAPRIATISEGGDQQGNGLELSKKATYDPETNKVTITLEAYTTGTVTTKTTPVDIVMVLDESGSMKEKMKEFKPVYNLNKNEYYYVKSGSNYVQVHFCTILSHDKWATGWHFFSHYGTEYEPKTSESDTTPRHVQFYDVVDSNQTRTQALKIAANQFATSVYQDAQKNNVDHRISVIGFSSGSTVRVSLQKSIREDYNDVTNAINALDTNGGTYIENGMKDAVSQFQQYSGTGERKRVVIVFTDGIPGSGTWDNNTINNSANPAINHAKTLKNTYGATVYTIGMLEDADPTLEVTYGDSDTELTNRFLHFLSSNYPSAQSMRNGGVGTNRGYYLAANSAAALNAIFDNISQEVTTPGISLDSNTVVKDVVTPCFNMPENSTVKVYTADYQGGTNWAQRVVSNLQPQIKDDTITVTNFDFKENCVVTKPDNTYSGKKLIIEFTVTPKDDFLGGNNVKTNGEASGVYAKGESVGNFEVPTVNVPIKDVKVTAQDKNVYLLGDVSAEELKTGAVVKVGDVPLDLSKPNYGLEDWQTEYVTITSEITDKDGKPIPETGLTGLTEDNAYTVKVTVAPKTEAAAGSASPATKQEGQNTPAANINVFKPELTFKDSEGYYGDNAPELTANLTETKWKHGDDVANETTMGPAPVLTPSYDFTATTIDTKQDIPVDVTVKLNNTDVTGNTTFKHTDCAGQTCALPEGKECLIHVKTCTLNVIKSGGANNEPYVFTVKKDGVKYTEVTIVGNTTQTIVELPVGTYSIAEDTGWSWRYNPSYTNSVELSATNPTGEITCTNTSNNNKWLNGFSSVVRNVFGVATSN